MLDESGKILRCNRAMSELLELAYTEIEGKLLGELLNGSLASLLVTDDQLKVQELSYGSRYFRARIEPVFLDDEPTGSILVLADLTRSRLAEHAALINERLAATGRMAHTIAHEINNPLEAITNLLFLLRSPATGPKEAAEYLVSGE